MLESGKMTDALSSLPFEKGGNEGGSAFFRGWKVHFIRFWFIKIELSSSHLFVQQENSEWLWHGDYATFNVEFVSITAEWT